MAVVLADRITSVNYEIRDIVARARKVQATGKKVHWFNIGDPNQFGFKPPQWITDAIIAALKDSKYSAYCPSEGDPELRAAIGRIEGVASDFVTIHSGLSEGIDFLFQALVNPGENLLLPSPSYPLYNSKLRVNGGTDNYYQTDQDFVPIVDDLRKKINSKTKAIVVINPNNPTGAVYPRSVLQEIVSIAGEHSLPIIADEIYDKMTIDEEHSVNLRDLTGELPLISGNGLSKNFIYPGSRVGYLAFHGEGIEPLRDAILKLCNARLSVNWEMQRGALAAFTMPLSHLKETHTQLRIRRDLLYKEINEIPGIRLAKPKAAFYSFPKVETNRFKDDREFVYTLLEETGVLVVPGSAFSPVLPGKYFRLVFLAPPEELHEAIGKIASFMKKNG